MYFKEFSSLQKLSFPKIVLLFGALENFFVRTKKEVNFLWKKLRKTETSTLVILDDGTWILKKIDIFKRYWLKGCVGD